MLQCLFIDSWNETEYYRLYYQWSWMAYFRCVVDIKHHRKNSLVYVKLKFINQIRKPRKVFQSKCYINMKESRDGEKTYLEWWLFNWGQLRRIPEWDIWDSGPHENRITAWVVPTIQKKTGFGAVLRRTNKKKTLNQRSLSYSDTLCLFPVFFNLIALLFYHVSQ